MEKFSARTSDPIWVGVDDGHYMVKAIGQGNAFSMLSSVAPGKQGGNIGIGGKGEVTVYTTPEGAWSVGDSILKPHDTRIPDYPHHPIARVLIHHALSKMGYGGKEVHIVTGLPVGRYFGATGEPAARLIEAKTKNILDGGIGGGTGDGIATIVEHGVLAQGAAVYFDLIMDEYGKKLYANNSKSRLARDQSYGIVDIGGRTIDCLVINAGRVALQQTTDYGVLYLEDDVKSALCERFDRLDVPRIMVQDALDTGICSFFGQPENVEDLVAPLKEAFTERVLSAAEVCFGEQVMSLERIVCAGGGARLLGDAFNKKWRNGEILRGAEFSNARGMYKFGKYVIGAQRKD